MKYLIAFAPCPTQKILYIIYFKIFTLNYFSFICASFPYAHKYIPIARYLKLILHPTQKCCIFHRNIVTANCPTFLVKCALFTDVKQNGWISLLSYIFICKTSVYDPYKIAYVKFLRSYSVYCLFYYERSKICAKNIKKI